VRIFFWAFCFLFSVSAIAGSSIKVNVQEIRSNDGVIRVALFKTDKGFPGKVQHAFSTQVAEIKAKKAQTEFADIEPGIYAVSIWHDENNDNKMQTNFLGIPREGVAVSNNAKGSFGPPKFKDAKFDLSEEGKKLSIRVVY
jgi:uncharacterized protein (DUF2141 family)